MNLEEINLILKQLEEGHYAKATEILKSERDRLLEFRKQREQFLIQESFDKYSSEIPLNNSLKSSNLYSYTDGLFIFSNGISIYELRRQLIVLKEMKEKRRPDSNGVYILKETNIKKLEPMLNRCKDILGDNKVLVEFESRSIENQTTIYESGSIQHSFDMKQIDYLDTFLGRDAKVYISDKNPIAYAESDEGRGYVLGIRR